MEAKLKALRVADLRDILQKASVAIPAKSNKSDLIAKVLASPAAVEAFNNQGVSAAPAASTVKPKAPESSHGGQDDDLLAPPEEFDWGSASVPNGGVLSAAASHAEGATVAPSNSLDTKLPVPSHPEQAVTQQPPSATVKSNTSPTGAGESQDEEMERRKKRAARFGIPVVEAKSKATPASNGAKNGAKASPSAAKSQTLSAEETARIEARAARFGIPKASTTSAPATGQKRTRSPAPVDNEELERRKKRAERFATGKEAQAQA